MIKNKFAFFSGLRLLALFVLLNSSLCISLYAEEIYARCWQCHKADGKSFVEEVVTLTGQNRQYLINQLYRFKTGERRERLLRVMNQIAAQLSELEMAQIARYYSVQDPVPNWVVNPEMTEVEQERYAVGEQHAKVCLTCHADAEVRPAIRGDWPYISGQNRAAIVAQLQAFALGNRHSPMMAFMQRPPFNDQEMIESLALYFSRQPPPRPEVQTELRVENVPAKKKIRFVKAKPASEKLRYKRSRRTSRKRPTMTR